MMYYPFFVFIILHLIPSVFGTLDVIPLIDIQAWTAEENGLSENHDDKSREEVAKMIGRACEESGFFAIKNHGVNDTIMQNMWESSRQFFDLPLGEKLKSKTSNESEYPYGYEKSETLVVGKRLDGTMEGTMEEEEFPPDLKETFSLGPDNPLAGMPPRRYPKKPPQMKDALASYYHEMEKLADLLLRIFAIALDLPKTWFEDKMDKHMSALRILNYFEVGNSDYKPQQLRAGAHTDYGALTILKSGGPGLQVMSRGQWVDVPYLPHENTFVINIADLMSRWTNDKWVSTLHRVVLPPNDGKEHRRQSIAYFVNINGDAKVTPLKTCVDDNNPSKYPPILARDHLMSKHLASMSAANESSSSNAKDEL